jgi:subtilisin-like proprotein convertase family protein
MRFKTTILCLLIVLTNADSVVAQSGSAWTLIPNSALSQNLFEKNYKPASYKAFQLNEQALRRDLIGVPKQGTVEISASPNIISVPNADGVIESFRIVESSVMEQGLADRFPMIKSYLGTGITHPGATIRFDISHKGFNASILSADRQSIYINSLDNNSQYIVFDRSELSTGVETFDCKTVAATHDLQKKAARGADDAKLRTYRLAVTVNGEFSVACLNGTEVTDAQKKASVMAVLVTDLNRANGIYERDFAIHMNYVANEDLVIFLDAASDPFPTIQDTWNDDAQTAFDNYVGNSNYDIGHFIAKVATATDENGNAGCIGCVCNALNKGSGFTAHTTVQGDPLVVDYWTHEMGHQFGANHTFTYDALTSPFTTEGTGANMEPGSGSTIMGYAGITGSTDVQLHSDDYFHSKSVEQITDYIKASYGGGVCAVITNITNSVPVISLAGTVYNIPKSTPFELNGSATDANATDVLSYCWEQYDDFTNGSSNTFPTASSTKGPLFRSRTYSSVTSRVFPILSTILSGSTNTWEVLPSVARDLNFKFTVRDNHTGAGANSSANVKVKVDGASAPFAITAPNTFLTWNVGEYQTVTWNVAGTTASPINCSLVNIELSIDGGNTFPIVLAANTANDGSEQIVVPNNITGSARVRVKSVNNIFFDISNSNFVIVAPSTPDFAMASPATTSCSGSTPSVVMSTASLAGYSTPITLSATGNPGGSTVVFATNPVTPGNTVNVSLSGTVNPGTYTVNISGLSGSTTKTSTVTFTVTSPLTTPALSTPANGANTQSYTPTLSWGAVAGATSYTITIATNAALSSNAQTISGITGTSYTFPASLATDTKYYWKVSSNNSCGTVNSSVFDFITANSTCATLTSTNVPKTISASSVNTVNSTLAIASGGTITDVDVVGLQGTHTWISDLTVSLKSPALTTVVLFDQICNDENNFNVNLDDAAATSVFPCPPIGGFTITPLQSLSAFNGQTSTGTWTLTIKDNYAGDGGSLTGWGLKMCIQTTSTLPVSWLDFTAKRNGERSVQVQWSTASEINNKEYQVERSRDGVSFELIGSIAAGNNATGTQQYIFNDMKPFSGVNYYRLKQVDKDGRYSYSSIAKVTIDNDKTIFSLSPNPATTKTLLNVYTEMKKVSVKVVDVTGKTAYSINKPVIKAGEVLNLPVTGFAKGYYLVVIESEQGRFTEKLIVQ